MPGLFDSFLRWIHLDPENKFFAAISDRLGELTKNSTKLRTNMADHQAIRDAITAGDGPGARQAMQAHIANVETYFLMDAAEDGTTTHTRNATGGTTRR